MSPLQTVKHSQSILTPGHVSDNDSCRTSSQRKRKRSQSNSVGSYSINNADRIVRLLCRLYTDIPFEVLELAHKLGLVVPPEPAIILAVKFIGCRVNEPSLEHLSIAWQICPKRLAEMELDALQHISWNIAQFLR